MGRDWVHDLSITKTAGEMNADDTLRKYCEITYPALPDAVRICLINAVENYAYQQNTQLQEELDTMNTVAKTFEAERNRLRGDLNDAYELLVECRNQLEYLHNKFSKTGTTENILSRVNTFLND